MTRAVLLIDFGSTFTKVSAVDVEHKRLLGTAQSPTSVQMGIGKGLEKALAQLLQKTGPLHFEARLACSSAAGGLRMVACGLVPELTLEAARLACLGAGAKLVGCYAYQLTQEDIAEIDAAAPDILLLCGGTDGGNREVLEHNARMLARCGQLFPVLLAGNRNAADRCETLLAGREVIRCANVMPAFGRLEVAGVQSEIRRLFLERIVRARGMDALKGQVDGVLMPTPAAVLAALQLLADGTKHILGIGELFAVDLGGATTDVYSMAQGAPDSDATLLKGLPEPYAKRTVEGDIGMRYSAQGVLAAAGAERVAELAALPVEAASDMVDALTGREDELPATDAESRLDFALAAAAVEVATMRHAGTLEQVYTPVGPTFVQTGKNLSDVRHVVVTGGALLHSARVAEIAAFALATPGQMNSLRPKKADILIDQSYILAGMGLLAQRWPECALHIMKEELKRHGT